jgi:RNA polymerase sigma factor (TIGR02999 family)
MPASSDHDVTTLLQAWAAGDQDALKALTPLVAGELHRLARHYMRGEHVGHTLQATALINEVYLRLIDWRNVRWQDRAHFFAVSARLMRRTLVDHARRSRFRKRGGDVERISLDEAVIASPGRSADLIAIDDALVRLSEFDARKGKVVELRFFGGLTVEEIAEVLGTSPRTVKREWSLARAWLYTELMRTAPHER